MCVYEEDKTELRLPLGGGTGAGVTATWVGGSANCSEPTMAFDNDDDDAFESLTAFCTHFAAATTASSTGSASFCSVASVPWSREGDGCCRRKNGLGEGLGYSVRSVHLLPAKRWGE